MHPPSNLLLNNRRFLSRSGRRRSRRRRVVSVKLPEYQGIDILSSVFAYKAIHVMVVRNFDAQISFRSILAR
jgi:hypothetical protein